VAFQYNFVDLKMYAQASPPPSHKLTTPRYPRGMRYSLLQTAKTPCCTEDLDALCVSLRSARSITLGNSPLTVRTFLFSPPLSAPPPACPANFCVFFVYRPTGRSRRTSLQLECLRNKTSRPVSASFRLPRAAFYQNLKSRKVRFAESRRPKHQGKTRFWFTHE
jgi:hypothetical protein